MSFCPECGKKVASGIKFCSECGFKIGSESAEQIKNDIEEINTEESVIWNGKPSGITSSITSSTKYELTNQRIRIYSGRVSKKEEEIDLIRIRDLKVKQGLADRAKGVGDIEIISTDDSTPKLILKDVKDPVGVKEIIRTAMKVEKDAKIKYQERV